jgi:site-specific recombinase XerD
MRRDVKKLLAEFLEDLEVGQGRSAKTVENYDRYLKHFFAQQKVQTVPQITLERIRLFRRFLSTVLKTTEQTLALTTQNYHFIALRQFLRYLARRDIPALAPDKVGLAKVPERDIDVLYPEEVEALLTAVDGDSLVSLRDMAILEVLFSSGIRIAELVSLDRDDIRPQSNEFTVRGKGNKVRVVFLSASARKAVADYLRKRTDFDPALFIRHNFPTVEGSKNLRLTSRSVQRMFHKYARASGLTKHITPHTLRHSFATDLLRNGADVRQVQHLLGHASITTTQIYTHLTDVHLRDVHARYHRKHQER